MRNCNELRPDQRLKKTGIDSHNSKLINLTPDKLVPKEAKYHSNCSKTYTKPGKPLKGQNDTLKNDIVRLAIDQLLVSCEGRVTSFDEVKNLEDKGVEPFPATRGVVLRGNALTFSC